MLISRLIDRSSTPSPAPSSSPEMNPSPAKRPRRTSSPSPERPTVSNPALSPAHTLPPIQSGQPTPFAGPSGWQTSWRGSSRRPGAEASPSPRMDSADEPPSATGESPTGVVFTRDAGSRAPRSMMACVRCRRQKMKCDGPNSVPCRGCRQAGQSCVFEPRSRPKSISVIPSRPFFPGRAASPASFYPPGPQPAPPITSRPMSQDYAFRPATRETMPPPSAVSSLYSGHTGRRSPPPPSVTATAAPPVFYQPQPPPQIIHPPPFPVPVQRPPSTPPATTDQRLHALERTIESTLRPLAWVPSALASLQQSVSELRSHVAPRRVLTVADTTWESYRVRAWPLTPWLVGLRDGAGLPGMVADFLGRRAEESAQGQGMSTIGLEEEARREVGRLIGEGKDFGKEELRALQVLATWTNDPIYAGIAIAQAKASGLQHFRRTHDDWRDWMYVIILDNLCHIPDYIEPVTNDKISAPWRERLAELPAADAALRDRDAKLLAWLEFAELLGDVYRYRLLPRYGLLEHHDPVEARSKRIMGTWRHFGQHWEAWASSFGARSDPILSLYYTYAVLFSVSPVYLSDESAWEEMAASPEGHQVLEQGRDAAIGLIQSICSHEIGRTLSFSYTLYRPLLALAVFHLISLAASLPKLPFVISSLPMIMGVLRQTYEALNSQVPGREALPGPSAGAPGVGAGLVMPGGLLAEVVESGRIDVGKRWIGMGVGRDAWRRVIG